jgi:uncharacterized protein (TIGR02266 family)
MSDSEAGQEDRRRDERFPVSLRVDYEDAADLLADYTENLSNGGTCVASSRQLEAGTAVRLTLSFPGLIEPIVLDGIVRWSRAGDAPLIGIEFADGPTRAQLSALVERIRNGDPALVKRALRVLVVEDNPHVASLLVQGLGSRSGPSMTIDCRQAADGREALQLLKSHRFDAMIVDVYLPVLDGVTLIGMIRRELHQTELPILAVSAGGDSAQRAAMSAGANIFIDKPMRLRFVLDTIRTLVHLDGPR